MRPIDPPATATWLLDHVGRKNPSLAGDLLEEYRQGRSVTWYWRQVLLALALDVSTEAVLVVGLIALYRIGTLLTIPGANGQTLDALRHHATGTVFSRYDILSGGNLSSATILALGIAPFVSASIIVQVATFLWWFLKGRQGVPWKLPIVSATWAIAVLLALVQSAGVAMFLERQNAVIGGLELVSSPGWGFRLSTMLILTGGSVSLMWLGDRITEHRIGNGFFLVFLAAVLAGLVGGAGAAGVTLAFPPIVVPLMVVGVVSYCYRRAFEWRPTS